MICSGVARHQAYHDERVDKIWEFKNYISISFPRWIDGDNIKVALAYLGTHDMIVAYAREFTTS